jgi:5'-3' exonuclease
MGIPSYYRKLVKEIRGLYCTRPDLPKWLLMDYNCLIYQILRDSKTLPKFTPSDKKGWEKMFIAEICTYTRKVIDLTGIQLESVFIAIDGVVPLAKMRQQRMRRFKAISERQLGLRDANNWDTNAITPGTEFMDLLATELRRTLQGATISDTSAFGEGEHKLLEFLKALPESERRGNVIVYGLDGDLFVLTLLANQMFCPHMNFYFLREEQQPSEQKEPQYEWISLNTLKGGLLKEKATCIDGDEWLKEYALAMSLLGNDFVPHGLAFRIKDGGHERLLDYLRRLHDSGLRLLDAAGELSLEGWAQLFKWLAADEVRFISRSVQNKMQARSTSAIQDKPLEWRNQAEGQLLDGRNKLKSNWQTYYARAGLGSLEGYEAHYIEDSAKQYLDALSWTFNYYCKGAAAVSFDWMYQYPVAPLFSEVSRIFPSIGFNTMEAPTDFVLPTRYEQLALVLPAASWSLLPKCKERQLLVRAPWLYPREWSYHSFGKRFFWECEAHIPIPSIKDVRDILA